MEIQYPSTPNSLKQTLFTSSDILGGSRDTTAQRILRTYMWDTYPRPNDNSYSRNLTFYSLWVLRSLWGSCCWVWRFGVERLRRA